MEPSGGGCCGPGGGSLGRRWRRWWSGGHGGCDWKGLQLSHRAESLSAGLGDGLTSAWGAEVEDGTWISFWILQLPVPTE